MAKSLWLLPSGSDQVGDDHVRPTPAAHMAGSGGGFKRLASVGYQRTRTRLHERVLAAVAPPGLAHASSNASRREPAAIDASRRCASWCRCGMLHRRRRHAFAARRSPAIGMHARSAPRRPRACDQLHRSAPLTGSPIAAQRPECRMVVPSAEISLRNASTFSGPACSSASAGMRTVIASSASSKIWQTAGWSASRRRRGRACPPPPRSRAAAGRNRRDRR